MCKRSSKVEREEREEREGGLAFLECRLRNLDCTSTSSAVICTRLATVRVGESASAPGTRISHCV